MEDRSKTSRVWPYWIVAVLALASAIILYLNALMWGSFSIANSEPQFLVMGRRSAYWSFLALGVAVLFVVIGVVKIRGRSNDS